MNNVNDTNSEPATMIQVLIENARTVPDRTAIIWEGEAVTYREMLDLATSFGRALLRAMLGAGDRVALYMDNSLSYLVAYFGTLLAHGVVVLINSTYRQTELAHIIKDSGARFCVTGERQLPELELIRNRLVDLQTVITLGPSWDKFISGQSMREGTVSSPPPDAPAVIGYTSGTTGRSKGAVLLHRNILANARNVCQAWEWSATDHLLLMLPLFHVHGLLVGISGTLVAAASCELHAGFAAGVAFDRLQSGAFTLFFGVPTMYSRLISEIEERHLSARATLELPGMRLFVSGSAALSPKTFAAFQDTFGHTILERYGMTETLMNLTNPLHGERRPGTVGRPFPNQEARIVDLHSRQPVQVGDIGEIEVRGPHVFAGYFGQPETTAASFDAEGWFRTGDLGSISSDGYVTICGRAKELIITGGLNVYPREVEEVLQQYAGVREVAVFGMPDPDYGERVCAALVCDDPQPTPEDVIQHCKAHLASFKKPRTVFFMDSLPRNAMGKVVKGELAEKFKAR